MHRVVLEIEDSQVVKLNSLLHVLPEESVKIISDEVVDSEGSSSLSSLVGAVKDKKIFSSIKDPVAWQKDVRDEW